MNMINDNSGFDCIRIDSDFFRDQPSDDVIFLLNLFDHLESKCDHETDRMEALAQNITLRTDTASSMMTTRRNADPRPANDPFRVVQHEASQTRDRHFLSERMSVLERAEIARRYQVPHHIFGTSSAVRGGKDLEFEELELCELRIQNYMAQMKELEAEIATSIPQTLEGITAKLRFMANLCVDGSAFASDVLAYVVVQSADQLCSMLDISVRRTTG